MATRLGVVFSQPETRHDVIVQTAVRAEELGHEAFVLPESWGYDSTILLTEIAMKTQRITLVPGILSAWSRTPATLAMTAATLHQVSNGRSVLGLGGSTQALVEGFHDVAFDHPAAKLRDVVTRTRALLNGERAVIDEQRQARPLRMGLPPVPDLPIWIAATGQRTRRVAAELADVWYPNFLSLDHLIDVSDEVRRLRANSGKDAPLTIAAGPIAVADPDPTAAREFAATGLAWYVCAMGDTYARTISEQGYDAEVQAIRAANPRPSPAHGVVPPESQRALDAFTVCGTPDELPKKLDAWASAVDILVLAIPVNAPWEVIDTTLAAAAERPA